MKSIAFSMNIFCLVTAIVNVGIALWTRDLSQIGGWVSATCGWALAVMYSWED